MDLESLYNAGKLYVVYAHSGKWDSVSGLYCRVSSIGFRKRRDTNTAKALGSKTLSCQLLYGIDCCDKRTGV